MVCRYVLPIHRLPFHSVGSPFSVFTPFSLSLASWQALLLLGSHIARTSLQKLPGRTANTRKCLCSPYWTLSIQRVWILPSDFWDTGADREIGTDRIYFFKHGAPCPSLKWWSTRISGRLYHSKSGGAVSGEKGRLKWYAQGAFLYSSPPGILKPAGFWI